MHLTLVSDEVEIWNRALARVGDNRLKLEAGIHVVSATAANPVVVTTASSLTFVDGDVNDTTEQITFGSNHNYQTGQGPFQLTSTATLPAGLQLLTDYWIIRVSATVISLSLSQFGPVLDLTAAATGGTHTISPVLSGFADGDLILMLGMTEMTQVNGRVFKINQLTASTFQLLEEDGSSFNAETTGGGTAQRIQNSGNKNAQACFSAWAIDRDEVFYSHPWNGVVKRNRLARKEASKAITGATQANPVRLTVVAHGYDSGDVLEVTGVIGMTELNDRWFTVGDAGSDPNSFELSAEDGTNHAAYVSGGIVERALDPFRADSGFDNRYDLPVDSLRILELVESVSLWMVENHELHTNDGPTVPVRYIFRQLDVTTYGSNLVSVLAYRLALDITEELTQSNTKRDKALQEFDIFMKRAARVDGQEQSSMPLAEDEWIEARLSTGLFDRFRDRFSRSI